MPDHDQITQKALLRFQIISAYIAADPTRSKRREMLEHLAAKTWMLDSGEVVAVKKNYIITEEDDTGIVIFEATYERTSHARPPEDGKLRELNSEYFWMTVISQSIIPKPGAWDIPPMPYSIIYT